MDLESSSISRMNAESWSLNSCLDEGVNVRWYRFLLFWSTDKGVLICLGSEAQAFLLVFFGVDKLFSIV